MSDRPDAAPLAAILAERIRAEGPIGVDAFMALCLGHEAHGYYRRRQPFGPQGDFVTAPEASQIFGELIGLALAQAWIGQGRPSPFQLVELGPGRGALMADALRAAKVAPGFLDAAELHLIETSGRLREAQAAALASAPLRPRWGDRLQDLPDAPMYLIANEFFDALPVRQFQRVGGAWRERRVAVAETGLRFALGAPAEIVAPEGAPEGAWFERSAEGEAIAAEIGRRLRACGGAALLIDYGYDAAARAAAGWPETFQAVKAHAYADPLAEPGTADLTCHVDFSALAEAAERTGAAASGPVGQGVFLRRLGAETRAAALARAAPARAEEIAAGLGRLTDPREMGALFKALGLRPRGAPPLAGFDLDAGER